MTDGVVSEGEILTESGDEGLLEITDVLRPGEKALACAAGWGHTALVAGGADHTRLLVAGRPHDFQTLLRLRRLPGFVRNPVVSASLRYDDGSAEGQGKDQTEAGMAQSSLTAMILNKLLKFSSGNEEDGKADAIGSEIRNRCGTFPSFTEIELPNGDSPIGQLQGGHSALAASAGVTAIIGQNDNTLYTFGINARGQCGVGQRNSNNVWDPTPVMGLGESGNEAKGSRITSVSLGLQHGLALDANGHIYSWGKGERGQLGILLPGTFEDGALPSVEYAAIRVREFVFPSSEASVTGTVIDSHRKQGGRLSPDDARVVYISAGMNHSAAVTASNHAWVWGKNTRAPNPEDNRQDRGKVAVDSNLPKLIHGLPPQLRIENIACGSHHTSILMEDGSVYCIGVTTDTVEPILDNATQIVPPGLFDMPVRQFAAHFDRTTIVGKDGQQVLEVHLWSHDQQDGSWYEPSWLEGLMSQGRGKSIDTVQIGWMHTLVVTDERTNF